MTFYPSKKRQAQWVKDHLNGGSFPEEYNEYWEESCWSLTTQACHEAMEWLDRNDIKTLAEAWDRCPETEWLAWIVSLMEPSRADARLWLRLAQKYDEEASADEWYKDVLKDVRRGDAMLSSLVCDCGDILCDQKPDLIRAEIPNPWLPKKKSK